MSAPGWHPDPGGLWEFRWWSGTDWTDQVSTGAYAAVEPYPLAVAPPANRDAPLLWFETATTSARIERYAMTWHAVLVFKGAVDAGGPPAEVLPLWMVLRIDVPNGPYQPGPGDVRLVIGYQGYTGPAVRVLRKLTTPHWAKAVIWRQRGLAATHP